MKPKICVSLAAEDSSEIPAMIRRAEEAEADLIEIRLDYLIIDLSDAARILEDITREVSIPMIATNRQYEQGGLRPQAEDVRTQILIKAAEAGFQYVDIELTTAKLESLVEKIKSYGAKPIVSFHDFEKTPSLQDMEKIVRSEIDAGAEICKLITTACSIEDNLECLLLARKISRSAKIVCFAMGRKGLISRVLSPIFGGYFTFASLGNGAKTAPGQFPIDDLKSLYVKLGVYDEDFWEN